ncbi:general transcription factor IIF subunit 2 [Sesamum indicum]|uniref:General transcription factor IIF subunit 2 n=1 Tax=Sesamum indicum TaxID=4182 RepID=A0A6I9TJL0_SESIN|nr:general transcription factor IIF subunit 2 [Sesamum indicum]
MAEKPNIDSNNSTSAAAPTKSSHLETSKADRHVWLMKCPPVVARAMQNHHLLSPPPFSSDAGSGQTVAKVVVSVDPLRPNDDFSSTQFTMELAGTADRHMPKCYSMDMSTDFIPMSVFAESSQGKSSVEGKIYHKFDMKPHDEDIEDYAKLCRERTNKYMTKTRQIQIINDDGGIRMRPMPGMLDIKSSVFVDKKDKKKVQAKVSENKRTRRDPEEMEKIMFKLFEKQPNWTLKQLIQKTDQPEQFLKDMLKLLCVYNNKGANQGTYELKPEYRRSENKSDAQQTTTR